MPDYSTWTDAKLEAKAAELAQQRTAIRLEQLKVSAELEVRASIAQLSPAAREVFAIRVGGGITPAGEGSQA